MAQKTPDILKTAQAINTTPIYEPAGTTGLIQPLGEEAQIVKTPL